MERKYRMLLLTLNATLCLFAFQFLPDWTWLLWFGLGSVLIFCFEIIFFIVEVWIYAEIINKGRNG
jgi:hypothetical protein